MFQVELVLVLQANIPDVLAIEKAEIFLVRPVFVRRGVGRLFFPKETGEGILEKTLVDSALDVIGRAEGMFQKFTVYCDERLRSRADVEGLTALVMKKMVFLAFVADSYETFDVSAARTDFRRYSAVQR